MPERSPIRRGQWLDPFRAHAGPSWDCPWCADGRLRLVPNSLESKPSAATVRDQRYDSWEPEGSDSAFTCWLKCDGECGEPVAVIGISTVVSTVVEDYVNECRPLLTYPPLPVFALPAGTPKAVAEQLEASFRLAWLDPGAAANRMRVALERLLDHFRIKKTGGRTNKGKVIGLTLHARILLYAVKQPVLGAQLLALKWLGNTASHEGEVSMSELLDAYEILEHTLGEIFVKRSKKIATLARTMTRAHGGRKRR